MVSDIPEKVEDSPSPEEDPERFLRTHPELARELKGLFRAMGKMEGERADLPKILGDFKILGEIGSGGMAVVYEAEQISLKRRVALKVLSPALSFSRKAVENFQREAIAAGRQSHPGIISIYAVGNQNDIYYIAQELVEGGHTLADRIGGYRKGDELPRGYFRDAAEMIAQVAEALEQAHGSGVIHRDVKPSNILITGKDAPRITDFGLARMEDVLTRSRTGEFSGTPYYTSPEQAEGRQKDVDHRTDIFSLGATLYEMLTLERPFQGHTSQEVLKRIYHDDVKDPRKKNPRAPRDLAVICMKAMERDPKHRYQRMADLAEDLRRFLLGEPILARPPGWARKALIEVRRRKLLFLAAGALLVAAAAVSFFSFQLSRQRFQEQQILEGRFHSISEALGWPNLSLSGRPWTWCFLVDQGDPCGYLLSALFAIDAKLLEQASGDLVECLARCRNRKDGALESAAHYLIGLVKHRQAASLGRAPKEREKLLEQGREALRFAGDFDPISPETLVWNARRRPPEGAGETPWYKTDIALNREHHLVHLYLGLMTFELLFRGGERAEFEETINHFKSVLEQRPGNVTAHLALGRTKYFFARFYNLLHLLPEAEEELEKARAYTRGETCFMIPNTSGQIWLLVGDVDRALHCFLEARELGDDEDSHYHNVFRGLGEVYARQGHTDKAMEQFRRALELMPDDSHVKVAMADSCLSEGTWDEALYYGNQAMFRYSQGIKEETQIASAYLVCARAQLMRKDYEEALKFLSKIKSPAIQSPRDMSLACFLLATFPEGYPRKDIASLANRLSSAAYALTQQSPLCLSARGVASFLKEDYTTAADYFTQALEARTIWPEDIREHHGQEDALDYYFLARCRLAAFRTDPGAARHRDAARADFAKAEALYRNAPNAIPRPACPEIFEVIRARTVAEMKE